MSCKQFLRREEVERRTGLPKSTIYHLMKRGEFPQNFKLSPRLVAWDEAKIDAWMRERADEATEKAGA